MLDILTLAAARKYTDSTASKLKEDIEDMSALEFKGIKSQIADLPLSGEIGDFWLVGEDSCEYFWTGSKWEAFGGVISGGTTDYEDLENKPSVNNIEIVGDLSLDDLGIMGKPLIFTDKSPVFADQSAKPDSGYENYTYRGVISNLEGVTADMLATVIFSEAQALSGNYAITCKTRAQAVTIYSNDNTPIIIPSIIVGTPVNVQFNNAEVEEAMNEIIGGDINE